MWSLESEKEKERERERVNDRETEKQRDREKENETEIIYEAKCNSKSNFFFVFWVRFTMCETKFNSEFEFFCLLIQILVSC